MRFLKYFLFLALTANFTVSVALAGSNIYYYFDDNKDPAVPTNSNGSTEIMQYIGKTHQTDKKFKFGTGSMFIGKNDAPGKGFRGGLLAAPGAFCGEIHKMTITAWICPAATGKDFHILIRNVPIGLKPGYIGIDYSIAYRCFFFGAAGQGVRIGITGPIVNCILQGEWLHFAVTFDEGKAVMYINGLPVGHSEAPDMKFIPAMQEPDSFVSMFTTLAPGSYVDDVGFFMDRALTEKEMDAVYTNGLKAFLKASPGS
ncbi:MAG: LamG-like jellyroll fold domain-containing protein [Chthoniobacterales bacterium]